ncbi:hypothetical protein HIM_04252 [Hirsutella minnesotensis 3608]|uniref:Bifunctional lycopene cyclase/phytoene synthase n=1 Tax=Hirsutella minnesotensis 3608 TaxID=1043627 RepID=A0A0F7ZVF5_9HYPO|nr:hypothetical protein HIM_04252 [Hirsutella minnesotensis 3608]
MGLDYWFVHFTWTIPPALLMTAFYWPFFTRLELYKISTLIVIAVLATTPWDSYLIQNRIWSYPPDAVAGPTLYSIPLEEVFFFVIQTYSTALLYIVMTKHLVLPAYLDRPPQKQWGTVGIMILSSVLVLGWAGVLSRSKYTYLGLILIWVCPFMMLLWAMSYQFLLAMPRRVILCAIAIPTAYLCMVDNLALQRGTWVIENETKVNVQVLGSLEVEEALFFFVTNMMIVVGLVAIDHAVAIAEYHIASSPESGKQFPSYGRLLILYILDLDMPHESQFLRGLSDAVELVSQKSQSMLVGSAMFQGGLRIDLLLLYSFYRVMDDLVDEAPDGAAARFAMQQCSRALESRFSLPITSEPSSAQADTPQKDDTIPPSLSSSVALLPTSRLSIEPFSQLLAGFETDLLFSDHRHGFPIHNEQDLDAYAFNVAGSVATSILGLVFQHYPLKCSVPNQLKGEIVRAGEQMGCALQYVNIARDIARDADIGRVYIPTTWLKGEGLSHAEILAKPHGPEIERLRHRLLDKADAVYRANVRAIYELPSEVQGPILTLVDSYMAIGKVMRTGSIEALSERTKLKLSLPRRLGVAWRAMFEVRRWG